MVQCNKIKFDETQWAKARGRVGLGLVLGVSLG